MALGYLVFKLQFGVLYYSGKARLSCEATFNNMTKVQEQFLFICCLYFCVLHLMFSIYLAVAGSFGRPVALQVRCPGSIPTADITRPLQSLLSQKKEKKKKPLYWLFYTRLGFLLPRNF